MKPLKNICILAALLMERRGQILNHARRRAPLMLAVSVVASVYLFWKCDAGAQSDLPAPQEPQLAEAGDWAADFNQAQMACYEGHMRACDSIWKRPGPIRYLLVQLWANLRRPRRSPPN